MGVLCDPEMSLCDEKQPQTGAIEGGSARGIDDENSSRFSDRIFFVPIETSMLAREPEANDAQAPCSLHELLVTSCLQHDHAGVSAHPYTSSYLSDSHPSSIATMGACLSCLGLRGPSNEDSERQRLLYDDYQPTTTTYGTYNTHAIPPEDLMSPEEIQEERDQFNRITQNASDQIVEIFPHGHPRARNLMSPLPQVNGQMDQSLHGNVEGSQHEGQGEGYQDILLSMIPGDKSKRSIRIYPASRPSSSSKDAPSVRSKASSSRLSGTGKGKAAGVFVKLDVDLP